MHVKPEFTLVITLAHVSSLLLLLYIFYYFLVTKELLGNLYFPNMGIVNHLLNIYQNTLKHLLSVIFLPTLFFQLENLFITIVFSIEWIKFKGFCYFTICQITILGNHACYFNLAHSPNSSNKETQKLKNLIL